MKMSRWHGTVFGSHTAAEPLCPHTRTAAELQPIVSVLSSSKNTGRHCQNKTLPCHRREKQELIPLPEIMCKIGRTEPKIHELYI